MLRVPTEKKGGRGWPTLNILVFPCLVQDRFAFAIQEALQLAQACGVTHFAEGFGLDLANAFAGDFKLFADIQVCLKVKQLCNGHKYDIFYKFAHSPLIMF